ncbi:DUF6114 domain-containing protein [Halomarina rubra]|uniref:DUF6114 domain-containing protein n=1 Tax=Halomarina rubra TaxID=2071873 RepID=A0ABD6AZJ1_9EURY|nr:DUF6114 domain-containing protein [Halomarina rubra]
MSAIDAVSTVRQSGPVQRAASYRSRWQSWKHDRPFWGGVLLTLSGLVIGIIPLDLAMKFALIPTEFAFVGLIFAVFVVLCGLFALAKPELAEFFGAAGMLISIISIFGALGGFVVGTLLGILGGALCIAWVHPSEESAAAPTEQSSSTDAAETTD